jgi:hypothetical protein
MASSTSRPRAITSAPSEMRCRSMPKMLMARKVIASTSGIDSATTVPVRQPRLRKDTASTITIASPRVLTKRLSEVLTICGWSNTVCTSMPTGRSCFRRSMVVDRLSPSAITLPPLAITMPSPIASRPATRIRGCGGSARPRVTRAMSPRRKLRPPTARLASRRASTLSNGPLTRRRTRSVSVSTCPAGTTAFCRCSASNTWVGTRPIAARRAGLTSM